jgi:meiotically up-regulated gene 157 (Mug157) protein
MGDFNRFVKTLQDTLKLLYKPKTKFLIHGDINTEYLIEST